MLATVLVSSFLITQKNEKEKEKKMAYRTKKPAAGGTRYGGMSGAKVRRKKSKKSVGRYSKRKASWSSGKTTAARRKRPSEKSRMKRTVRR